MRIGSLFTGVAGLDMAVQDVFGGTHAWFSEIDKAASKVLAYRFPGVPNLGDITQIDWATVEPVDVLCGGFPCQDVSAAGKRAGIKDGTRSGLWALFAEAIDALQPQYVVIENVRGLLSAAAHRTVEDDAGDYLEPDPAGVGDGTGRPVLRAAGAVLGDLADLGYDAQWATVAAADVGAPHRRERVFIVAEAADAKPEPGRGDAAFCGTCGHEQRLHCDWIGRCTKPCECLGFAAADAQGDGWDEGRPESAGIVGGFDAAVSGDEPGVALLPTPTAQAAKHGAESRFGGGNGDVSNLWQIAHLLPTPRNRDGKGATASRSGDNKHDLPSALAAAPGDDTDGELWPTIRNAIGYEYGRQRSNSEHGGPMYADDIDLDGLANAATEAVEALPSPLRAQGKADSTGKPPESGLGSLRTTVVENASAWGKYAPAIARWEAVTGVPAPAPTEPNKNGNPRLAAEFSSWLMGWPPGWVTDPAIGISRNDQLRCVGNGVVTLQAVAAIRYLLAVTAGLPTATKPAAEAPALLPTPCVVDRLATGEMTLEEWDESRRSQKERSVGSFGPRGDSLGAAGLRVEEGTERPDYSTTKKRR